jgi:hypothetical protein
MRETLVLALLLWVFLLTREVCAGNISFGNRLPGMTPYTRDLLTSTDANHLRPDLSLPVLNVRDHPYEAKGDGTTDDSAAVQAAIDAAEAASGGTVFFPPGTYDIKTTTLVVDADKVWLVGLGRGPSQIQYSGTGAAISIGTAGGTARNYCGITNLTLVNEGTARASGTIGIIQYSGQSLCLRDVWIISFEKGIFLDGNGGSTGYLVAPNLDNVRISGPTYGLYIGAPVTALSSRMLHIVGPGKTEAGTYGIYEESDCGQGNYFTDCTIETIETGILLGGNLQAGSGIRLESCTTGIAFTSNAVDNCSFHGIHAVTCTANFSAPPTGASGNHLQINGAWYSITDGTNGQTNQVWTSGATEHVSLSYTPGASGYLNFRKVGVGDILHLNYADRTTEVMAGLKVQNGATSAGYVDLYEDSDNGTNKVRLQSPAPTADVTISLPAAAGILPVSATSPISISAAGDISMTANPNSAAGYVASGVGQNSKVWKTNASGVPAWRDDATGGGTISGSGATVFNTTVTSTGVFQDLDLSATVGANTTLVFLEVKSSAAGIVAVKPKGYGGTFGENTNSVNTWSGDGCAGAAFEEANNYRYLIVVTDSSGVIQIGCNNGSSTLTVKVVAYIK